MTTGPTPRRAAALVVVAALSGCLGSAPPVPRDHFYRVVVSAPRGDSLRFAGTVSVSPIEADGLLRERPLLYSTSDSAYELQQYDYHYWTDAPPRMLQSQLVDYLRGSGTALAVVTPDLRLAADYEVSGRIKRLERLLDNGTPRVAAELELAMTETANNRLIVVETYGAELTASDDSVEASVRALNQALSEIFARFLADAGARHTAQRAIAP